MRERSFSATALRMFSGVIIWSVHFAVIYGLTALACARSFASARWVGIGIVPWMVGLATLAAVACALVVLVSAARATPSFQNWMTASLAALALIAMIWEAWPAMILAPCA